MVPLPFTKAEYAKRLKKVREEMTRRGMDLLVVTDVANQYYLTAYDGWSFYTPQIVVVPLDEDPYWIGRGIDSVGGRLTCWMDPAHVIGFPDNYVQQKDRHPMDWMAELMASKGWGKKRIGIETDTYYFSPKAHAHLTRGLPNAKWVEADLLVSWVRAVKSPAEIEMMRNGARLVEGAMRAAFEAIGPGVRECDSVARIYAAEVAGHPKFAGDITSLPPTILAGPNSAAPHMLWTDRKYTKNETVAIELAGACRHYTAGLARTMQLGKPPAKVDDVAKVTIDAMQIVVDAVKPGVEAQSVAAAFTRHMAKHGLKKESRIGYSIGIGYPPDWGEHTISLRAGDTSVLEPGNIVHSILGMWMDDFGFEVSETILVTRKGSECLTEFPRELFRK
jgi:Xaa-Pro dipeptidase